MSEQRPRYEKQEEKEEEKRHEKQEKNWEEKWRRDPVNTITWAAVLIWAGVVLLIENLRLMAQFSWWRGWPVFLAGWGLILIIGVVVRLLVPEYRRPVSGSLILGFILLAIGLASLTNWVTVLPLALIAIGLVILLRPLMRRRR